MEETYQKDFETTGTLSPLTYSCHFISLLASYTAIIFSYKNYISLTLPVCS